MFKIISSWIQKSHFYDLFRLVFLETSLNLSLLLRCREWHQLLLAPRVAPISCYLVDHCEIHKARLDGPLPCSSGTVRMASSCSSRSHSEHFTMHSKLCESDPSLGRRPKRSLWWYQFRTNVAADRICLVECILSLLLFHVDKNAISA